MWLLAAYNGRRGAHHTSAASAALGEEEAGPAAARCGHPVGACGAGSRFARAQPAAAHAWHRTGRLRGRPLAGSQSPGLARKVVGVPFRVAPATPGFCSNTYDPGNSGSSGGGRMRVGKGVQSFTPRNVTHIGTGGALVPSPPPSSPHPSAQPNSSAVRERLGPCRGVGTMRKNGCSWSRRGNFSQGGGSDPSKIGTRVTLSPAGLC